MANGAIQTGLKVRMITATGTTNSGGGISFPEMFGLYKDRIVSVYKITLL